MKIKPKNPRKKALDTSALADEFGNEYVALTERAKTANANVENLKNRIKETAEELGEKEGDCQLLKGSSFTVGYQIIGAKSSINWAAFKAKFPKQYGSFLSLQLDEQKVADAITSGTLSRSLLKKFLVTTGTPSKRITVKRSGTDYEA